MKLLLFLILIVIVALVYFEYKHPCIESHTEVVHHPEETRYLMMGKMWMPQYYDAYDSVETICDRRK